jgi:hypothetical protein
VLIRPGPNAKAIIMAMMNMGNAHRTSIAAETIRSKIDPRYPHIAPNTEPISREIRTAVMDMANPFLVAKIHLLITHRPRLSVPIGNSKEGGNLGEDAGVIGLCGAI